MCLRSEFRDQLRRFIPLNNDIKASHLPLPSELTNQISGFIEYNPRSKDLYRLLDIRKLLFRNDSRVGDNAQCIFPKSLEESQFRNLLASLETFKFVLLHLFYFPWKPELCLIKLYNYSFHTIILPYFPDATGLLQQIGYYQESAGELSLDHLMSNKLNDLLLDILIAEEDVKIFWELFQRFSETVKPEGIYSARYEGENLLREVRRQIWIVHLHELGNSENPEKPERRQLEDTERSEQRGQVRISDNDDDMEKCLISDNNSQKRKYSTTSRGSEPSEYDSKDDDQREKGRTMSRGSEPREHDSKDDDQREKGRTTSRGSEPREHDSKDDDQREKGRTTSRGSEPIEHGRLTSSCNDAAKETDTNSPVHECDDSDTTGHSENYSDMYGSDHDSMSGEGNGSCCYVTSK